MQGAPITVVIPTAGNTPFIDLLLEDLQAQTTSVAAVHIVVNNKRASVPVQSWNRGRGVRTSFLSRKHYYAQGMNFALRQVETKYVAMVNDDVRLSPTWTEAMIGALEHYPEYGSFATRVTSVRHPSLLDSCGASLYLSGRATANGWLESIDRWKEPQEVFSASGCLSTYRISDLRQAGFLDPAFVAYMEDVDLGFRLQLLGRPCLYWPNAEAAHIGGATRKTTRFAARLAERNTVLTMIKNLPASLVRVCAPDLFKGHSSPCPFEGDRSWGAWRAGKAAALWGITDALSKRQEIQAGRRVSDSYIHSILKPGRPRTCHL